MGAGASTTGAVVLCKEGDEVKVNYKEKGKYFPGTITACNENGTYHVKYHDGDVEKEVRASQIRAVPSSSPKKGSPGKSPGKRIDNGLNIPPQLAIHLHRFWALLVQGLQCKAWRLGDKEPTLDEIKLVEETNEVLWLLPRYSGKGEATLCVDTEKNQTPGSSCLLFRFESVQTPRRIFENEGLAHPMFLIHDGLKNVVIGVDTEKSASMLVQLISQVLDCLAGKVVEKPVVAEAAAQAST